ncbi:phosphotransferase [Nonomuraea thailandensis]
MNQLGGGNDAGACRVGGTVRRPVRDWTASVHELLRHLEREGFEGAPRVLGVGAVPSAGARWRTGVTWTPGTVVVHNDATPFNAAWHEGRLTGFFDWDFAAPSPPARTSPGWRTRGCRSTRAASPRWRASPTSPPGPRGCGGVADDLDEAIRELDDFLAETPSPEGINASSWGSRARMRNKESSVAGPGAAAWGRG